MSRVQARTRIKSIKKSTTDTGTVSSSSLAALLPQVGQKESYLSSPLLQPAAGSRSSKVAGLEVCHQKQRLVLAPVISRAAMGSARRALCLLLPQVSQCGNILCRLPIVDAGVVQAGRQQQRGVVRQACGVQVVQRAVAGNVVTGHLGVGWGVSGYSVDQ